MGEKRSKEIHTFTDPEPILRSHVLQDHPDGFMTLGV
jgi:hypothetical protein